MGKLRVGYDIFWSASALDDLNHIIDYMISRGKAFGAAMNYADLVDKKVSLLSDHPLMGKDRSDLLGDGIRQLVIAARSRIFYSEGDDRCNVSI